MDLLKGLSLFSGIGGIDIAVREWVKPVAYCEIEPYCQSVLLQRMSEGYLPKAPIWDDVRTLPFEELPDIDLIYGGFPCQDISCAGRGKGLEGERSGLFFEILRLAKEIKPTFLFLENVPAITTRGGLQVVNEIASLGYDCRWCVISAASVGALHRRERWFLLAHAVNDGTLACKNGGGIGKRFTSRKESRQSEEGIRATKRTSRISADVADTSITGLEGHGGRTLCTESEKSMSPSSSEDDSNTYDIPSLKANLSPSAEYSCWETWGDDPAKCWPFESRDHWQKVVSEMGKCSDGLSHQVDRLKALGNAVVPIQAKEAFRILLGLNIAP